MATKKITKTAPKKATKKTAPKVKMQIATTLKDKYETSKWFKRALFALMFLAGSYYFVNSGLKALFGTIIIAAIPLFMGFVIAWLCNPLVNKLIDKNWKRKTASTLVFVGAFILVLTLIFFIMPIIVAQARDFWSILTDNGPDGFQDRLVGFMTNTLGIDNAAATVAKYWDKITIWGTAQASAIAIDSIVVIGGIAMTALMGVTIGFYLLSDYDKYIEKVKDTIPESASNSTRLAADLSRTLKGWAKGWLLDQLFVFALTASLLLVLGVEQWLILALIMLAFNTIPFIGPIIGAVVIIVFLLVNYIGLNADVVHFIFGYGVNPLVLIIVGSIGMFAIQTLESVWWVPRVYGKTVNIHPVTTLVGLAVVGAIFSPFLTPLTIPFIATVKTVYKHKTGNELHL